MADVWPQDSGRYISQRVSMPVHKGEPHLGGEGLLPQPLTLTSFPVPSNSSETVKHCFLVKEMLSLEVEISMGPRKSVSVSPD